LQFRFVKIAFYKEAVYSGVWNTVCFKKFQALTLTPSFRAYVSLGKISHFSLKITFQNKGGKRDDKFSVYLHS